MAAIPDKIRSAAEREDIALRASATPGVQLTSLIEAINTLNPHLFVRNVRLRNVLQKNVPGENTNAAHLTFLLPFDSECAGEGVDARRHGRIGSAFPAAIRAALAGGRLSARRRQNAPDQHLHRRVSGTQRLRTFLLVGIRACMEHPPTRLENRADARYERFCRCGAAKAFRAPERTALRQSRPLHCAGAFPITRGSRNPG